MSNKINMRKGDTIQFGDYAWQVLDVKDSKALIITEDIVELRWYHSDFVDITWADSALRKYLNSEFYKSFTPKDRVKIATVTNSNPDTLQPPLSWANTRLISEDAVEAVREMKQEGNSPMRTIGSLTLCRSLLKAGLVDRFRVVVFPVITGSTGHDRIYDGFPDVALDMVASQTFDGRIQLLEYVPRVLAGPPGTHPGS
jgi:dihydrofolate reductase